MAHVCVCTRTRTRARVGTKAYNVWPKVIPKVKWKQRSLWQAQHETPKYGPVFIVKVVDFVVIEANIFYKSYSISSK